MGFTTKDVIAVMVVGAVLIFNGIAMWFDKPLDAGTLGMAGIIVGHYFGASSGDKTVAAVAAAAVAAAEEPLAEPYIGDVDGK